MVIDVAGSYYLQRLHDFGRRMTTADYLRLMKEAKLKKKRKLAMARHYDTLILLTRTTAMGLRTFM
jgi:hypothetical protein